MKTPRKQNTNPPLLSVSGAARYLNMHRDTVTSLVKRGKLAIVYISENSIRIPMKEIERFVNETTFYTPSSNSNSDDCSK